MPGRVKVKKRLGWKMEPEKRKQNPQSRIGWGEGDRDEIPPSLLQKAAYPSRLPRPGQSSVGT